MPERLCPKCGAYWACDCQPESGLKNVEELSLPVDATCQHDWVEAVGVEVDLDLDETQTPKVLLCRLCGLFAVELEARSDAS